MDLLERFKSVAILSALILLVLAMYYGMVAVLRLDPQPIIPATLAGVGSFLGMLVARQSSAFGDLRLSFLFGISLIAFTVTYWMTIQMVASFDLPL